jgi:hypothetical protein
MHFTHVDSWQAFYYTWYGSQPVNGQWRHWGIDTRPEGGVYDPTHGDLPTDFYPDLGPYSSTSTDTLTKHMSWLTEAGIGTIIVSWWGKGSYEDKNIWNILNAADDWGLKVGFNIEPYGGGYIQDIYSNVTVGSRTPQTAKDDGTTTETRLNGNRLGMNCTLIQYITLSLSDMMSTWASGLSPVDGTAAMNMVLNPHSKHQLLGRSWELVTRSRTRSCTLLFLPVMTSLEKEAALTQSLADKMGCCTSTFGFGQSVPR